MVSYAVKRFVDNLPAIFDGSFNHALLEDEGEEGRLLQLFKTVARQQVFNRMVKTSIEYSRKIINKTFHRIAYQHALNIYAE